MASMHQQPQPPPVAKTALDSLQAKLSAVSVGYTRMVVENESIYNHLIRQALGDDSKPRRQIPLVNAGYATRVMAMSHAIDAFVRFHQHIQDSTIPMQIVFLGCGVDVIGLWAHSLVKQPAGGPIRIVEVDMPTICRTKKEFMMDKGFVVQGEMPDTMGSEGLVGCITTSGTMSTHPDYFLLPVDLRNVSGLDQALQNGSILDPIHTPTLVVSELVLAYLPPDKTNQLLQWCSSHLVTMPTSAMVLLEPLGYRTGTKPNSNEAVTVLQGYRRDYCQQFQNKMERGFSTNTPKHGDHDDDDDDEPGLFFPLGTSIANVEERVRNAGFALVHARTLGSAAAHTRHAAQFQIPEIFDEHAALLLHLQAYTVVVGFARDADGTLMRLMCPAHYAKYEIPPLLLLSSSSTEKGIVYTILERRDEMAMKNLFQDTYANWFDTYPAIRKMVKGVMGREFASSTETNSQQDDQSESEILKRYQAQGGCFFVAVRYYKDSTNISKNNNISRQVLGCVGVRRCERRDDAVPNTLEVFRLSVQETCRGQGIGRHLLEMVERFARSRSCPKLIANTLTFLEPALQAYESCGYRREGDSPLGTLTMRTYFKLLSPDV